ncbi:MAG TPA: HAD family hydrolase [Allosphingosinicella sp.]|nr:HAD family hydrolase [Allosphingosinicella sp.]
MSDVLRSPALPRPRAALFDVDGTLVDTNDLHTHAWAEIFRRYGHHIPLAAIRDQIGKGGDNLLPTLLPGIDDTLKQEMDAARGDLFKCDYLPRAAPFPGVRALFERLVENKVKIVLASSASGEEVDYHLNLIACSDLVSASTSKDDVESSKPCPDIFAAALAKVAPIPAEEAVVIGDTPWDIEAAARAGLRTIAFRSGGFDEAWLRSAGAAEIYDGAADLLARYDQSLLGAPLHADAEA